MPTDDNPPDKEGRTVKKEKRRSPVKELARRLGVGRSTIYLLLKNGGIPGRKLGHGWYIPDVDEIVNQFNSDAWENWRRSNEKSQRGDKKSPDSKDNS